MAVRLTRQRSLRIPVDCVHDVVWSVAALFVLALVLIENPKEEDVLVVDPDLVARLVQTAFRHHQARRRVSIENRSTWTRSRRRCSASHQACRWVKRRPGPSWSPPQSVHGRCRCRWDRWGRWAVETPWMTPPSSRCVHRWAAPRRPLSPSGMCCQSSELLPRQFRRWKVSPEWDGLISQLACFTFYFSVNVFSRNFHKMFWYLFNILATQSGRILGV